MEAIPNKHGLLTIMNYDWMDPTIISWLEEIWFVDAKILNAKLGKIISVPAWLSLYIFTYQSIQLQNFISLTHWGRVTHICVSKLTIIGSDNGLSPGRCQAIIWTNAGLLLIGPLGINISEILIEILTFSFKKMRLKVSFVKWRPFCLGLNVLKIASIHSMANDLVIAWWKWSSKFQDT